MGRKFIISVGGGRSQLSLIKAIHEAGYGCVAFDKNPEAEGRREADYFFLCSTHDFKQAIHRLQTCQYKWQAVMVKAAGYPVISAAHIAQNLHLDFIAPEVAKSLIWKDTLIHYARKNQIPVPESFVRFYIEEIPEEFFPAVLRPNQDISGRWSTVFLKRKDGLFRYFEGYPKTQVTEYTLSQYIPGYDIALVTVFDLAQKDIRGVWLREYNQFTQKGTINFGGIKPLKAVKMDIRVKAAQIVDKILQRCGATRGFMSFSFRVGSDDTVYLIEVHPDLGGEGVIDELLPAHLQRPFLKDLVRFCAGDLPRIDYLPYAFQ